MIRPIDATLSDEHSIGEDNSRVFNLGRTSSWHFQLGNLVVCTSFTLVHLQNKAFLYDVTPDVPKPDRIPLLSTSSMHATLLAINGSPWVSSFQAGGLGKTFAKKPY